MSESYKEKIFEFSRFGSELNDIPDNVRVVQIGETCLDAGACIERHIQICHEITFVISGRGVLSSDDEEYECSPGDIQIVSKGTSHKLTASDDKRLRYIHFAFDFEDYEPKALSEFYGQCKNVFLHDDGNIRLISNMLVDEYYNSNDFSDIMKRSLIQMMLVMIWRKIHSYAEKGISVVRENVIGKTVHSIIKYIDNSPLDKLTVKRLAEEFSYSESYISHLFKEKTGVSIQEYIIAIKVKRAQDLLREGKTSLNEIVELVGYQSKQSFCKIFKKYTGYTPGEFKNKIKDEG